MRPVDVAVRIDLGWAAQFHYLNFIFLSSAKEFDIKPIQNVEAKSSFRYYFVPHIFPL